MKPNRTCTLTAVLTTVLALGCNKSEPSQASAPEPTPAAAAIVHGEEHAAHTQPAAVVAVETPPSAAKVFFAAPADGAEVKGKATEDKVLVSVKMGVEGMAVKPAGEIVSGTGHHHIIVDGAGIALGEIVPKDDTHIHFGNGQTETELMLSPGEHTLTLQFADGIHRSYGPSMSSTVKIKVVAE